MDYRFMIGPAMAVALISCGPPSEEAQIMKLLNSIETLVEKNDRPRLAAHLAEDYRDFQGRDKPQTEDLIDGMFKRRRGIVVHLLHARIGEIHEGLEASLETDVVLSSGGAEFLRKAVRFAGEFYRFRLDLRKSPEGWRIVRAEWEILGVEDLFPESGPIFKKLFENF